MNNATEITAASLLRVSTLSQAEDGTSLDTQAQLNESFIRAREWQFAGHYVEEEGVSGASQDRPDLARLLADVQAGLVQVAVVYKVDRYARDTLTFLQSIKQIEAAGAMFLSASESWDAATSSGRLHRTMLAVFAGFEREQIIERTSRGLRAVAKMGYWPGGPPPYGFSIEPVPNTKHKHLVVAESEAAAIRLAVDMIVDEGSTTEQVAARLNAEGYKRRRAARWTHSGVRRMLKEVPLSGSWEYARTRGKKAATGEAMTVDIPSIIAPERQRQLQAALATTAVPHVHDQFYVLARGLLRGPCAGTYYGTYWRGRGYRQYACLNNESDAEIRCGCRRLDANQAEAAVWGSVTDLLSDPERLLVMAKDFLGLRQQQVSVERDQLGNVATKIARLERTLSETVVEYAKVGLPGSALAAATEALQSELEALKRHQGQLQMWQEQTLADSDRMRRLWELADLAAARVESMTVQEQRRILTLLEVQVTVLGWEACAACKGRGKVQGGRGGVRCKRCVGLKQIARIRVEGTVFDRLLEALAAEGNVCECADVTRLDPGPLPRWRCRAPSAGNRPPVGAGRPPCDRCGRDESAYEQRLAVGCRPRTPPRR